jgi:acyl-CoA synthetase (AMP-forming)/AMP-acid ligase II
LLSRAAFCRLPPAACLLQYPLFKVPRRILFVDRIPKGATGKARRIALREELK